MSEHGIETGEGVRLVLEETATKTRTEILAELRQLVFALMLLSPPFKTSAELVAAALSELVHWMHDSTGRHRPPSEIIKQEMAEAGSFGSSTDTPPKTPGAKTND